MFLYSDLYKFYGNFCQNMMIQKKCLKLAFPIIERLCSKNELDAYDVLSNIHLYSGCQKKYIQ